MRRALMEAQAAFDEDEIPVGAIIVCKDRIISRAHNLTEMLTDVTAHAEMQAITSGANMLGGKYLKDCTLYVTVEPCVMCAGALGWAQISRVVYVDILQQRDFVNRWMNDTGQGETWTWGLGRYAMATFTYRFNDLSR